MVRLLWLSALISLTSILASASTWSGVLVDSKCFTSIDNNRGDIPSFVNWDRNSAIEYCSPRRKTNSFAVVQADGLPIRLDANGNEKAHTLLGNDRSSLYIVKLTGEKDRHVVRVSSISVLKRLNRQGKH
jgi:hypothetical protein